MFAKELTFSVWENKMAKEMHETLFNNAQHVTGAASQLAPLGEESFLKKIVTPIYEVLQKVNHSL